METPYRIVHSNDMFILIVDLDTGPTITNTAYKVIPHLDKQVNGIGNRVVYYRDTMGRYDQLRVKNGCFDGFAPCTDEQMNFLHRVAAKEFNVNSIGLQ